MALNIGIEKDDEMNEEMDPSVLRHHELLVSWIMSRVDRWRQHRNAMFQKRWAEYYRLWRGFWDPNDKNKDAERSRLIAPALQQSVEMTVAEMEEATFGRSTWFDLSDDYSDEQKEDMQVFRDQLLDEFERHGVKGAVSESYLNGSLYGTGLGKVMIGRDASGDFKCWLESIAPMNFVIDTSARNIEEALGCAHEIPVPRHRVVQKQVDNVYYPTDIGEWTGETEMFSSTGQIITREIDTTDMVFITEYHGLVPRYLLQPVLDASSESADTPSPDDSDDEYEDLVEAIVTIGNKSTLLRAVQNPYENPYSKVDRAILAYQHETVPNQFWGRGVCEKGYNPQKALDAELRARIDALGLLTYPVMGADATRIPRGTDLRIKPGKLFLTNGRPSEVLEPIIFGNLNPATFQQSADLERMVQMGTGAMDSAISEDANPRNGTASGMSMLMSGFVKRSKRTMQNVERNFLTKFIEKALWRYMQFDAERFPKDFKFKVYSAMGIMAKEFEQATLTQLLQIVPSESPVFHLIIKGIIESGATPNKGELLKALEAAAKPDPQQQQLQQQQLQLQLQNAQLENQTLQTKAALQQAQSQLAQAKTKLTGIQTQLEPQKLQIMAAQTMVASQKASHDAAIGHKQAAIQLHGNYIKEKQLNKQTNAKRTKK